MHGRLVEHLRRCPHAATRPNRELPDRRHAFGPTTSRTGACRADYLSPGAHGGCGLFHLSGVLGGFTVRSVTTGCHLG
jgi:hypothetical protein